ncbi:MAG: methionine synthase [Butyricicoccus sp.]|nr:methionine synthase [Butyricicoccus sp.]
MDIKLETFNRNEVLQYLLWRGGEIESGIDRLIDDCIRETLLITRPRYTYRVLPIDRAAQTPSVAFAGNDVQTLLADCNKVILFAATLGAELEMAIRRAQTRDLTRALVLDACGSAAIEAVCDTAVAQLEAKLSAGEHLTDRFSPGYSDMDIACQPELLTGTDAPRQIGLTATDAHILVPRKSVTALIGIADRPQTRRFRGCAYCSMFENCSYRKAGKTCGRI